MGIRAQNAKMKVVESFSEQEYWLTDLKGKKVSIQILSAARAEQFCSNLLFSIKISPYYVPIIN
jgi:hypothetical protein